MKYKLPHVFQSRSRIHSGVICPCFSDRVSSYKTISGGVNVGKMMSYCGLMCDDCNAYKATAGNDDVLRKRTAEEWSRMYGADLKAEDINCLGCRSGVNFGYCGMCRVRACNLERNISNCSECDSFSCDKLEEILNHAPEVRERLNQLRK